jgi:hypothetical protein
MIVVGKKTYVVVGNFNGRSSYLSFDKGSGGYPNASDYIKDVTTDLEQVDRWLKNAKKLMPEFEDPKVFSYEINLVEVDMTSFYLDDKKMQDMLDELTPDQLRMLRDKLK